MKYWLEKGKKGFSVYKYLLRRRPNQGDLATSRVEFGGKSAPKGLSALTRPGVFDVDISCGKEPRPVSPLLPPPKCVLFVLFWSSYDQQGQFLGQVNSHGTVSAD